MTIVIRPSCWHKQFGPNGLSTPAQGLCLNFFAWITADFNISSALRWAIQDQQPSLWLIIQLFRAFSVVSKSNFSISNFKLLVAKSKLVSMNKYWWFHCWSVVPVIEPIPFVKEIVIPSSSHRRRITFSGSAFKSKLFLFVCTVWNALHPPRAHWTTHFDTPHQCDVCLIVLPVWQGGQYRRRSAIPTITIVQLFSDQGKLCAGYLV